MPELLHVDFRGEGDQLKRVNTRKNVVDHGGEMAISRAKGSIIRDLCEALALITLELVKSHRDVRR